MISVEVHFCLIEDTEERKLREQLDFFGQMKLFSGWSHNLLQKVLLQCTLVTFRRNQKIYCQGEVAKEVYFIKTGEVKVNAYHRSSQRKRLDF